jgi:hypothetical protein
MTTHDGAWPAWAGRAQGARDRALVLALRDVAEARARLIAAGRFEGMRRASDHAVAALTPMADRLMRQARERDLIDVARFDARYGTAYETDEVRGVRGEC